MKPVVILGATSGIGQALAREMAAHQYDLIIAGRDAETLDALAKDLHTRSGVSAVGRPFDARALDELDEFFRGCVEAAGGELGGLVLCHGYAGTNERARTDWAEARAIVETNYVSAVRLLNLAAEHFERQGAGFICGVSSVAGDRGRQSNYIYGSSKAGLTAYLQGLRNRLASRGVSVTTVKPGYVDTVMTYGQPRTFLVASPKPVARAIRRAIESRRSVVYTPWFWRWIMLVVRLIPEPIFKRMKF